MMGAGMGIETPQRGDHDAALDETLVGLHRAVYPNLVRLACLLLDDVRQSEEIVQEAFLRARRSWQQRGVPASPDAYIRAAVVNLARSQLRRRRVVRRRALPFQPHGISAEDVVLLREDQREVLSALRALSSRQRACLVLRYWADLSEAEIAATLGISTGSVKTHSHRGLAALEKRLETTDDG